MGLFGIFGKNKDAHEQYADLYLELQYGKLFLSLLELSVVTCNVEVSKR